MDILLSYFPGRVCTALLLVTLCLSSPQDLAADSPDCTGEPNAKIASTWFPPMRNVWTPIGLRNHPLRFNVLYNGAVIADTHPLSAIFNNRIKTYLDQYRGQGVMLTFYPTLDGSFPTIPTHPFQFASRPDGGVGLQQWNESNTPVLRTMWPITYFTGNTGVVLREEVFAHTPGAGEIVTGKEPLFSWIHLTVDHVDPLDAPSNAIMMVQLANTDMMQRSMFHEENLTVHPQRSPYPRELKREVFTTGTLSCARITEPDGKVRIVGMTSSGAIFLKERTPASREYFLEVHLPAVKGSVVDLLLPMIPTERAVVDTEVGIGYEGALAENELYWTKRPATAANIETPEPVINEAFRRLTQIAQVVSETNPENGTKALLTGSWNYDTLWPTPACMGAHMHLDLLGYHDFVGENLEIFRKAQGTSKAPGDSYKMHPGYFCAPRELSSIDWLTDHGSILHTVALHALLSGDEKFTQHWLEPILKACDFLAEYRANTEHAGVKGILPSAVATDAGEQIQSVWNIAWNYKGLTTAVRLLRKLNHPRAEFFAKEARETKEVFVKAYREHNEREPKWVDSTGTTRTVVSSTLFGPDRRSHPFFLDTGALVLVYAGLLDADDELIKDSLAFYREGPNTKLYDPRGNMHQRAILTHEISSCEPCYSFNILCSLQSGDRKHFMEGIYSLLVGGISPTFSGSEHRHGIYALPAPGALMIHAMRMSVIDDTGEDGGMKLLQMVPLAWVSAEKETKFENMATEYGPVSLKFALNKEKTALNVSWNPSFRTPPKGVSLKVPPISTIESVVVNGKPTKAVAGDVIVVQ